MQDSLKSQRSCDKKIPCPREAIVRTVAVRTDAHLHRLGSGAKFLRNSKHQQSHSATRAEAFMKTPTHDPHSVISVVLLISFRRLAFQAALAGLAGASALGATITFTNNFTIGAADSNYDGADIVVSNCTVKMDGPHAFNSLLVAAGGVVSHTPAPQGTVSNLFSVSNEPEVLFSTNPVVLPQSNIYP